MYDDIWTAAKGMYKMEPAIADGGEVIIYAPHITEVSYTHGKLLDQIGYHVRDYFLEQWDAFKDVPGGVLAHSTHLRGIGTYENGVEKPRIKVTLATGIPEERCRRINLGYMDPATLDIAAWEGREDEGIMVVHKAGEMLYRLRRGEPVTQGRSLRAPWAQAMPRSDRHTLDGGPHDRQQFGLVGLAVMGENLVLNIESNGFSVAVYNRTPERTKAFLAGAGAGKRITGAYTLPEFIAALERPRAHHAHGQGRRAGGRGDRPAQAATWSPAT